MLNKEIFFSRLIKVHLKDRAGLYEILTSKGMGRIWKEAAAKS
jgi:hypothetical protein